MKKLFRRQNTWTYFYNMDDLGRAAIETLKDLQKTSNEDLVITKVEKKEDEKILIVLKVRTKVVRGMEPWLGLLSFKRIA